MQMMQLVAVLINSLGFKGYLCNFETNGIKIDSICYLYVTIGIIIPAIVNASKEV